MTEVLQSLQSLGITEKQAQVYLACLELGNATIQELSEKSGVKRTSIYNFLDDLKKRGLVTEIHKGNKLELIAEDPHKLVAEAKKQVKSIESAIPSLMSMYNMLGNKPKVRYYQGVDGLKRVYEQIVDSDESTILGFSDYEKMFDAIDMDWLWTFPEKRLEKKMEFLSIAKDGEWARIVKRKDAEQLRQTKIVPEIEFDTEVNIYGNNVALLSFRRPYAGVIIEDRAIATTMRSVWKLLWNLLPEYESPKQ